MTSTSDQALLVETIHRGEILSDYSVGSFDHSVQFLVKALLYQTVTEKVKTLSITALYKVIII